MDLLQRSPENAAIHADVVERGRRLRRLPPGQVCAGRHHGRQRLHYRYDPARPESVLARTQVDDALQTAAGRKKSASTTEATQSSEPGARYIDFLIPGLLGMNLMNSGMWGIGFAVVDMRQRKLLKRFVATPMRRTDFLLALGSSRLVLMMIEVGLLLGFGVLVFHMRVEGALAGDSADRRAGRDFVRRHRPADRQPRAEDRERQRADQPGDDADVDLLRRVLLLRALPCRWCSQLIKALPLTALNDALRAIILQGATSEFAMAADRDAGAVGRSVVCAGAEVVPLELIFRTLRRSCAN